MNTKPSKTAADPDPLDQTIESVKRIQSFPVESLPRAEELGRSFAFDEAVIPAKRLVRLFQQISIDHLHELPDEHMNVVRQQADSVYKSFSDILHFDPAAADNAAAQKQALIKQLSSSYQSYFSKLINIIAYLGTRVHDFSALESEGRAAVQALRDEAEETASQFKGYAESAEEALQTVRQMAAEQGVSQHAAYFKSEADDHESQATIWRDYTLYAIGAFVALAAASLYLHHLPWLEMGNVYQAAQIAVSKIIVFAILAYIVVLCARNFLAHRHNAIVNRHRQNALLTFRSLAEAAGSEEKQDIVLTHAASCIFSPQETGYTKAASGGANSNSASALFPYVFREASSS